MCSTPEADYPAKGRVAMNPSLHRGNPTRKVHTHLQLPGAARRPFVAAARPMASTPMKPAGTATVHGSHAAAYPTGAASVPRSPVRVHIPMSDPPPCTSLRDPGLHARPGHARDHTGGQSGRHLARALDPCPAAADCAVPIVAAARTHLGRFTSTCCAATSPPGGQLHLSCCCPTCLGQPCRQTVTPALAARAQLEGKRRPWLALNARRSWTAPLRMQRLLMRQHLRYKCLHWQQHHHWHT